VQLVDQLAIMTQFIVCRVRPSICQSFHASSVCL